MINPSRRSRQRSSVPSSVLAALLLIGVGSAAHAQNGSAPTGNLEQSHGAWRTSKLDGATVYNDQGNNIGTINDMLVGSDGQISNVVISVGGFLGVGNKYVEVPFSKLKFEPSKSNSASAAQGSTTNSTSSGSANGQDYSIVLPGVSKDALTSMTGFNY